MKIARFFAVIFACIGVAFLVGSMGFLLLNRNADVRIKELPQEAVAVSDAFAQALNAGDLEAAALLIYGQPDLGTGVVPENPESALIWDAFRSSISFEYSENLTVEQSTLIRRGSITVLDVSAVLAKLPELVQSLLDQRIAAAEVLSDIYDEQNEFREELVDEVLQEALRQSISQDGEPVTTEVSLKLVKRDGHWWIVPQQNLLQIFTGLA